MAKYFVYSRKSKFTKKGDSVGNQIEMARRYIVSKDPDVTDDDIAVFEDDGFSGKNTNRPGFSRMMERIKLGEPKYMIVYRLDRISRSVSDFCTILDILQKKGVHFISLNEDFDTNSPLGRVMIVIASAFAQMEREIISERVADNMLELSKKGTWLGGLTPLGYNSKRVPSDIERGITKEHSVLVVNDEKMRIVENIYQMYDDTRVLHRVRAHLFENKNITFSDKRIKSILTNPVYCAADEDAYDYFLREGAIIIGSKEDFDGQYGIMPYNRHADDGNKNRQISEWIIAVGRHKPVISGRKYVDIQKSLLQNAIDHPRNQAARNEYALLTGLLVCGKCGKKMYTQPQNSGRGRKENTQFTYICETRKTYGPSACDCKSVSGKVLDKAILEQISGILDDTSQISQQLEKIRVKRDTMSFAKTTKESLIRDREKKRRTLDSLLEEMVGFDKDDPMRSAMREKCRILSADMADLDKKISSLEDDVNSCSGDADAYEYIESCLKDFTYAYETMSTPQKRDLLNRAISKITWDGVHADIFLYGAE